MKTSSRIGALLMGLAAVPPALLAQGSISRYGTPCPATGMPIAFTGTPAIGATLTFTSGASSSCGQPWPPQPCSFAFAAVIGLRQQGSWFSHPAFPGSNGCLLLTTPDIFIPSPWDPIGPTGQYVLAIPNMPSLAGLRFFVQAANITGFQGSTWLSFTDALDCVIG